MFSSSILLPTNFKMSLFGYFFLSLCHIFSTDLSVVGHLACFMNTVEQMPLWYECASFGYMSKSGISGLLGRLIDSKYSVKPPDRFPNCLYEFALQPAMEEGCTYSTASLAYALIGIFNLSY